MKLANDVADREVVVCMVKKEANFMVMIDTNCSEFRF